MAELKNEPNTGSTGGAVEINCARAASSKMIFVHPNRLTPSSLTA